MLDFSHLPSHLGSSDEIAGEGTSPAAAPQDRATFENDLVLEHMGLAESIARGFSGPFGDQADIRQVAFLGLVKAVKRFDPELGFPFAAFARVTISGEIKRYLRDHTWAVRPPRSVQELSLSVAAVYPALEQTLRHSPSRAELAEHLCVDEAQIAEGVAGGSAMFASSLDELNGGQGMPIGTLDPADVAASRADLAKAMGDLAERDRTIVHLRYVKGLTQSEIAEQIGTSQVHVSRALSRILAKVRAQLGEPYGAAADWDGI
jgi:RNA polymerase sigma-B factor